MEHKIDTNETYSPILVTLTKDGTPTPYRERLEEMLCNGYELEEAKEDIAKNPIELELYFEEGHGLFAVEIGAADSGHFYSPYTREEYVECDGTEVDVRSEYRKLVKRFKEQYGGRKDILDDFYLHFVTEITYTENFVIKGVNLDNGNIVFDNDFGTALGVVTDDIFCDDALSLIMKAMIETELVEINKL